MSEMIEKIKDKYMGIIVLIAAVVVFIVVFDPFGGKIEGEWYVYYGEFDGEIGSMRQDSTRSTIALTFYDNGTMTMSSPKAGYYNTKYDYDTYNYSYSNGKLAIDGDIVDCKIQGDEMTISGYVDGTDMTIKLKRASN